MLTNEQQNGAGQEGREASEYLVARLLLERVDAGDPARQLAGGGAGRPGPLSPEGGVVFAPILPDGIRSAARSMGE